VKTARLDLIPFAASHARALSDSPEAFERAFGVPLATGLREFFVSDDVSPEYRARLDADTNTEPDPWTHGFALVHRADRIVVGMAGFKGPPGDEGVVEIAYGVAPAYQGQGLATEAARALVGFAFDDAGIHVVRAHTLPTSNASTRVLTRCGFRFVGDVVDPEDGPVWRWEKQR
jgi:RimJ/RimL family protein N-acetyltransferase